MKKFFTLLLTVFACIMASAEKVSEQVAFQKAQQFMQGKQFVQNGTNERKLSFRSQSISERGYYVFNIVDSAGFVIVASDDRMPEILGYSERGTLDIESAPSNVKWLLEYYNKLAESLTASPQRGKTSRTQAVSVLPIEPLISTEWGQGVPYNNQCPVSNNEKCQIGCVATAMAQILNYYRYPLQGVGNHSYVYDTNKYEFNFENTIFEWGNMRECYSDDGSYSNEQAEAVSRLMYACAISTEMQFGVDVSYASFNKIGTALKKYFGYEEGILYKREDHNNDWTSIIYNEIDNKRPIIYCGGNDNDSHAFILDGADKDGRFHINWGWNGELNGYFEINSLNPINNGGFDSNQSIFVGFRDFAPIPKLSMESINIEGPKVINNKHIIKPTIKNCGTDFNSNVYLFVSEKVGDIGICIDTKKLVLVSNEFRSIDFDFTPSKSSTYYLRITADEQGKDVIGTKYLNISDNSELISFTDAAAKRVCVNNWDSNGDGELSYSEAADVKTIGRCFNYCEFSSFEELKFFINLKEIPEYAFKNCPNLRKITIPEGLEKISEYAFHGCGQLESLVIPQNVDQIGYCFVSYTPSLASIEVDKANTFFCSEDGILYDKSHKTILAFPPAKKMRSFVIPQSVETISGWSFRQNRYLEDISITENIKSIGSGAFEDCESLKSVVIPDNVEYIECNVWSGCKELELAYIGKNVKSIKNNIFGGCVKLEKIDVDQDNVRFCSMGGILYSKELEILYQYPPGKKDSVYIMPENVQSMVINPFEGTEYLKNISLSKNITIVEEAAFMNATGLVSFVVPDWVTEIGRYSFQGCVNMKELTISKNVKKIGVQSFWNCKKLSTVISLIETPFEVDDEVFNCWGTNIYEQAVLIVPQESVEKYKKTSGWSNFENIIGSQDAAYINSLTINSPNVLIYDIQGKRHDNLQKGMNIIRSKNGKTRKVLVK